MGNEAQLLQDVLKRAPCDHGSVLTFRPFCCALTEQLLQGCPQGLAAACHAVSLPSSPGHPAAPIPLQAEAKATFMPR